MFSDLVEVLQWTMGRELTREETNDLKAEAEDPEGDLFNFATLMVAEHRGVSIKDDAIRPLELEVEAALSSLE